MKHAKLLAIPLAMALICSSTIVASAATTNEIAVPAHSNVVETERNPIGNLTMAEREQLANQKCDSCPTPYHFSLIPHSHEITKITDQYHGEISRGVVAETTRRVDTTAVLSYEKGRSVSNSFSVSIGFEEDVISSTLGYDVSYSTNETASYSVDVPVGKLASITLYDMYDVSKFDVKTTFVYNTIPITYSYEYGDGWAQQWTDFGFSAKVW